LPLIKKLFAGFLSSYKLTDCTLQAQKKFIREEKLNDEKITRYRFIGLLRRGQNDAAELRFK